MIAGTYRCSLINKMGEEWPILRAYGDLILYEDENMLKGRMFPTFFWLDSPFRGGTVDGNNIEFTVYFATPCQQFGMTIKATIDGDTITGTADTPTGVYVLEGQRVQ
ncbi:MAG: hypothetical protein MJ092_05120 [Lachnospiraceae bacterium]|nr:hypothetical protein [Lachnospiraceae bacterium]